MKRLVLLLASAAVLSAACREAPTGDVLAPDARPSLLAGEFDPAGNDLSIPVTDALTTPVIQLASPPPVPTCRGGNLQTLAVASHSGGGLPPNYGPNKGNDGVFGPGGDSPSSCDFAWMAADMYPSGAWYELDWTTPQRVCQIWVDTKPLASECGANPNRGLYGADIQTWDGVGWVDHGSVTSADNDWGYVITACPVTHKLRLYNVGPVTSDFQASNPVLYELKVYDCNAIIVAIDIKPGSWPNAIQCDAEREVIAVAILTTPDFDALTVDHTSVQFEGASETHVVKKTGEPQRHETDVDLDGDMDLVFHFRLGATDLDCSATEGMLTGETYDGALIEGTDAVAMIGGS